MSDEQTDITDLKGLVATVVISGHVQQEFAKAREDARAWSIKNGFAGSVEWRNFPGKLVERGRDMAIKHAFFDNDYDWCLQIDADATFPPVALGKILAAAYADAPDSDVVGAYANHRKEPYLPTVDTGTGTWERVHPGRGVVPVIRTGGHFILIKKRAIQKMGDPPWFRSRVQKAPVDALAEVDNFARTNMHGENPLAGTEAWQKLLEMASKSDRGRREAAVGEDSSFCDRLKASGGQIYVDTDLVTGHVTKEVVGAEDFKDQMKDVDDNRRLACGVRETRIQPRGD